MTHTFISHQTVQGGVHMIGTTVAKNVPRYANWSIGNRKDRPTVCSFSVSRAVKRSQ